MLVIPIVQYALTESKDLPIIEKIVQQLVGGEGIEGISLEESFFF